MNVEPERTSFTSRREPNYRGDSRADAVAVRFPALQLHADEVLLISALIHQQTGVVIHVHDEDVLIAIAIEVTDRQPAS